MNDPAPRRRRTGSGRVRSLAGVLARQAARVRSGRALASSLARALLLTFAAALAAAPLALAWGIAHADVDDYLGPHQVRFATGYSGELRLDLGPIGNAYLPSPVHPIGVTITVGGVGTAAESVGSLFSEQTLAAYVNLYNDPQGAVEGIVERLQQRVVVEALKVEALLLAVAAAFALRGRLLSPWAAQWLTVRRAAIAYMVVLVVVAGSILAPPPRAAERRIPVTVPGASMQLGSLTVDSVVLADLLDRGIKGIALLSERQQRAVRAYIDTAAADLVAQRAALPRPADSESMLMGFSDLHCNRATTELLSRLIRATEPTLVVSSGDDTVNGTAGERGCVRREAAIAGDIPFLVATGNHDSNVTESQMAGDGMIVLDGGVVEAAGLSVLGDDDPEQNIPFSVDRIKDRPETEEQLGQRMVDVARSRGADVIVVHQPAASTVAMETPDPPARLVLWGHFHAEVGPTVVTHDDGSWTVGMQQGTAGGVRQPTFTSFSTPFSPPLISADVYFYFRDRATGLITGVQPVHFLPDARVRIEDRIATGDLEDLPLETRVKLGGATPTPEVSESRPARAETPSR